MPGKSVPSAQLDFHGVSVGNVASKQAHVSLAEAAQRAMDRPLTVRTYLDFEKPIAELESKVAELKALNSDEGVHGRSPRR